MDTDDSSIWAPTVVLVLCVVSFPKHMSSLCWAPLSTHLVKSIHPSIFYRLIHRSGRGGAGAYPSSPLSEIYYVNITKECVLSFLFFLPSRFGT